LLPKKKFNKIIFFNIIAVGRLTFQKDYFTILKSIKLIKKDNFILKIYGKGELKDKIIKFIKKNKLTKKVRVIGHVQNKNSIYAHADLLIHASIFEGLPNNIVEAINYSVPVIAANSAGGTSEILKNGRYGSLFETSNYIKLASKINEFLQKPTSLQKKIIKGRKELKKFVRLNTTKELEKKIDSLF